MSTGARSMASIARWLTWRLRLLGTRRGWWLLVLEQKARRAGTYHEVSDVPLDVVIPCAEKDADVLPYAVRGLRENLRHPEPVVFIVAPDSHRIRAIAQELGSTYVLEDDIAPLPKSSVGCGWVYQQFLKWSGGLLTRKPYYLTVDADTVLIRPQAYAQNGRVVMNCSDEYHLPYMQIYQRLLGEPVRCPVSFTSHQMLFDVAALTELKECIALRQRCEWHSAILNNLDHTQRSPHSDYETYGQYLFNHHRDAITLQYWQNRAFPRSELPRLGELCQAHRARCKSLSFHSYMA